MTVRASSKLDFQVVAAIQAALLSLAPDEISEHKAALSGLKLSGFGKATYEMYAEIREGMAVAEESFGTVSATRRQANALEIEQDS